MARICASSIECEALTQRCCIAVATGEEVEKLQKTAQEKTIKLTQHIASCPSSALLAHMQSSDSPLLLIAQPFQIQSMYSMWSHLCPFPHHFRLPSNIQDPAEIPLPRITQTRSMESPLQTHIIQPYYMLDSQVPLLPSTQPFQMRMWSHHYSLYHILIPTSPSHTICRCR